MSSARSEQCSMESCSTYQSSINDRPRFYHAMHYSTKCGLAITSSVRLHCNAPWSVCVLVRIWHPCKMAEWIGMQLGIVVDVGPGIAMLNFGGDHRRRRGSFGRG